MKPETLRKTAETRRQRDLANLPLDQPATVALVNRAMRLEGHAERLVAGRGYYYFINGRADRWFDTNINVYRISQLTLRQALESFDWLVYHDLRRQGYTPSKPEPRK